MSTASDFQSVQTVFVDLLGKQTGSEVRKLFKKYSVHVIPLQNVVKQTLSKTHTQSTACVMVKTLKKFQFAHR